MLTALVLSLSPLDQEDFDDDCKDGSHRDFAENLNDQLLQLAEGYADPTPSVLLGDFEQESEEEYSGQCPIELGVPQANSTEGKVVGCGPGKRKTRSG